MPFNLISDVTRQQEQFGQSGTEAGFSKDEKAWGQGPIAMWRGALERALTTRRSRHLMVIALALILALSAVLHVVIIRSTSGAFPDIEAYGIQAQTVFHHQNVYVMTTRYPYPPVWIWIVAAARWCADAFHMPFPDIVRIPMACADLTIGVVLFAYTWKRTGPCFLAVGIAALYALNPVALLISAAHGQFDALVVLFLMLAVYFKGSRIDRRGNASSCMLGVAIALKGFPILLLPYFVRTAAPGKRLRTAVFAVVPTVVSIVVYVAVFGYTPLMYAHIVEYRSTADLGWLFVLLRLPIVGADITAHFSIFAMFLLTVLFASEIFVLVFATIVPSRRFASQPATAFAVTFAVLYATTATMSVQYVLWILPFLCLAAPLDVVPFSMIASAAAIFFYTQAPGVSGIVPDNAAWVLWLRSMPVLRTVSAAALIVCSALIAGKMLRGKPNHTKSSPRRATTAALVDNGIAR